MQRPLYINKQSHLKAIHSHYIDIQIKPTSELSIFFIHSFIHSFTLFSVYPYTDKVPRMWKLSK